jgi:hypothetical protein
LLRPPWQPGQRGNPQNKNQLFNQCQKLCRERSPEAADKMYALMSCGDERIEFMAATWIYERAWGKPKDYDPSLEKAPGVVFDLQHLTREQLQMLLELSRTGAVKPADTSDDANAMRGEAVARHFVRWLPCPAGDRAARASPDVRPLPASPPVCAA